eukprot:tig00021127_g18866.t1
MAAEGYDHLFKVLLVGDSGVGKSSILTRFIDDKFDENQPSTIGVDFKVKAMTLEGKRIKLTIWDTAGQERFRTLTSSYYRGAQGIILVYDVSRRHTFENLENWLKEIEQYNNIKEVVMLLVANKIDRLDRQVQKQEGLDFARQHRMLYIETSAKTKLGIQQAFTELVQKVLDSPELLSMAKPASGGLRVQNPAATGGASSCASSYC